MLLISETPGSAGGEERLGGIAAAQRRGEVAVPATLRQGGRCFSLHDI